MVVTFSKCKNNFLIWIFILLTLCCTILIIKELDTKEQVDEIEKHPLNFDFFDIFRILKFGFSGFYRLFYYTFMYIFTSKSYYTTIKKETEDITCSDFYASVCGNLTHSIKPDVFDLSHDNVKLQIMSGFNESARDDEPRSFHFLKTYYNHCMDGDLIKKTWKENLLQILEKVGRWPVLNNGWNETNFEWTSTLFKLLDNGFFHETFVPFNPSAVRTISEYPIIIHPARIDDNFELYLNDSIKVAIALGADPTQAKSQMQSMIEFQRKLKELSEFEGKTETNFTEQELTETFPYLNWRSYMKVEIQGSEFHHFDGTFIMDDPHYYENLEALIADTPKIDVANYMIWKGIEPHIEKIAPLIDELDLKMLKPKMPSLSDKCLKELQSSFPMLFEALYVRNNLKEDKIGSIMTIFRNVQARFIKLIENKEKLAWMDPETKEKAVEKVQKIKFDFDFAQYWSNDFLDNIFGGVQNFETSYLDAIMSAHKLLVDINMVIIVYPAPWKSLNIYDDTVYDAGSNRIMLNLPYITPPVYDYHWGNNLQYSRLGYFIAHEISHSILLNGRDYNVEGKDEKWYSDWTKIQFDNHVKCIVDHYNKYEVNGIHLNGTVSLVENLADVLGLKVAYLTYKDLVKENTNEETSTYTQDQLFFINYAEYNCRTLNFNSLSRLLQSRHPLFKFRVQGSVSNLNEFSEAFNCPKNSQMNPANKCPMFL